MFEVKYKALSIRQPWAWLTCKGYKDIENRDRPTNFRGRIYVHAGKKFDYKGWNWLCTHPELLKEVDIEEWASQALYPSLGAIIGEVDIIACCANNTGSPWFMGKFGFVLLDGILYDKPIPCKGKLGFFTPEVIWKEENS